MNMDRLLVQTITYATMTGRSVTGDPTYGDQAEAPARVELVSKLIRTPGGTEKQASHRIVTSTAIGLFDRIWVPGADTTSTNAAQRPITVNSASDLYGGGTLYEVYL